MFPAALFGFRLSTSQIYDFPPHRVVLILPIVNSIAVLADKPSRWGVE